MKLFRILIFTILLLLLLEVIKTLVSRIQFSGAYFSALFISCVQVLLLLAAILVPIYYRILYKHKRKLLLTVLMFCLTIGILEGLANWMLYRPSNIPSWLKESYYFYYDFLDRTIIQFENDKTAYHPDLTYTLQPSSRFNFSNAEFNTTYSTNRMGIRDADENLHAPEIICIGDSYTMGWGVEQSETFPVQLSNLSGKKILNEGISSYGTARELELLKKTNQVNLQYLIIQYCSNDIVENSVYIDSNYHLPIISENEFESAQTGYKMNRIYFPGKVFFVIFQHFCKSIINRVHPIFSLPSERISNKEETAHAEKFAELLLKAPIDYRRTKVVITRLNAYHFLEGNFLEQLTLIAARAPYYETFGKYISILNLRQILNESDYYILDVHLKPSGHRKIAIALDSLLFKAAKR